VFLLILESLGSTELLFILVMALVFFGPRKLPQISRSLGKNLAEFRKASEDFKRTWEKEVNIEEFNITADSPVGRHSIASESMAEENALESLQPPIIEAVTPDETIARQMSGPSAPSSPDTTGLASDSSAAHGPTKSVNPSSKHDWL
jgi:Tat protein translocase TatB subunit